MPMHIICITHKHITRDRECWFVQNRSCSIKIYLDETCVLMLYLHLQVPTTTHPQGPTCNATDFFPPKNEKNYDPQEKNRFHSFSSRRGRFLKRSLDSNTKSDLVWWVFCGNMQSSTAAIPHVWEEMLSYVLACYKSEVAKILARLRASHPLPQ